MTARRADRFLSRDRVFRRLVKEPRAIAQARLGGVPELLGDVDDVPAFLDKQRGEGAAQIVGPRVVRPTAFAAG